MEESTLWQKTLHQLRKACFDFDKSWIQKQRVFDTYGLVTSIMDLCAGDEQSYRSVMHRYAHGQTPAASSFCKARNKMPAFFISEIRDRLLHSWDCETESTLWFGHQTYAVDGSRVNLPSALRKNGFYTPPNGYYPQGLLTGVFRLSDRMITDLNFSSNLNERESAKAFLAQYSSQDVMIYDRGYFSYVFALEHLRCRVGAVFRISRGDHIKEIKDAWNRKENDFVISLSPGKLTRAKALRDFYREEMEFLRIRVIKYLIEDEEYMLLTTILDESITAEDFKLLYAKRWLIEEFLKPYKQTLKIELFSSKSLNGVVQEIEAAGLLWNLTMLMDKMVPESLKKTSQKLKNIPLPNELPTECPLSS